MCHHPAAESGWPDFEVHNAWEDGCGRPAGRCVEHGADRGAGYIGVSGWLLSCRAAYLETVDVLYGRNRLHIAQRFLGLGLSRLFAPARLAAIRDLELVWPSRSVRGNGGPPTGDLRALLDAFPETLPGLRCLLLRLENRMDIRNTGTADARRRKVDAVIERVDAALARCERLVKCRVELPTSAFVSLKYGATGYSMMPGGPSDPRLGAKAGAVTRVIGSSTGGTTSIRESGALGGLTCGWLPRRSDDMGICRPVLYQRVEFSPMNRY